MTPDEADVGAELLRDELLREAHAACGDALAELLVTRALLQKILDVQAAGQAYVRAVHSDADDRAIAMLHDHGHALAMDALAAQDAFEQMYPGRLKLRVHE